MMNSVELKNISKSFGSGTSETTVLNQINFSAQPGELTLITGPSGSGKSTLLTIMGALQNADSGQIQLDNVNVESLSNREKDDFRLNHIGFILQSHNLVPFLTVAEQFSLVDKVRPSGNLNADKLDELLKTLNIENVVNQFPSEFSGGQSQRVTIARGLYTDPQIILADEPTAALDSKRVTKVCELLQSLAKEQQKTIIVVTHDQRMNAYADHIYTLVDGQISEN